LRFFNPALLLLKKSVSPNKKQTRGGVNVGTKSNDDAFFLFLFFFFFRGVPFPNKALSSLPKQSNFLLIEMVLVCIFFVREKCRKCRRLFPLSKKKRKKKDTTSF